MSPLRGEIYANDINMLIVRSIAGELGILPRHARLLTELVPHVMRVKAEGGEIQIAVGGGFMEVTPELITVLANAAELEDAIDVERAKAAYKRASDRIAAYQSHSKDYGEIDIRRAENALARAKARLAVKGIKVD